MAVLPRYRSLLLKAVLGLALALLSGGPCSAGQTAEGFLDAVLASVDGRMIAASDVAITRALSLFGARPSDAPIRKPDAERLVDARLIEQEAVQLAIGGSPQEFDEAWRAAAERVGGMPALQTWIDQAGLTEAWVRQLVERDLRWRRFIDLRFRSFVFVSEDEVTQALGPGEHSPEVRERTRERLQTDATNRDLEVWLVEARKRASVRYAGFGEGDVPVPFPMPKVRP
jgi:hypothetical protein